MYLSTGQCPSLRGLTKKNQKLLVTAASRKSCSYEAKNAGFGELSKRRGLPAGACFHATLRTQEPRLFP
jgi:hypothetical protein